MIYQRPPDLHRTRVTQRCLKDRQIHVLLLGKGSQLAVCRSHAENEIDVEAFLIREWYQPRQTFSSLQLDGLVDFRELFRSDFLHPADRVLDRVNDVKAGAERFGQTGGEEDGPVVRIVVPAVQLYVNCEPVTVDVVPDVFPYAM